MAISFLLWYFLKNFEENGPSVGQFVKFFTKITPTMYKSNEISEKYWPKSWQS